MSKFNCGVINIVNMLIKNYFELTDEHKQNILFQLEMGKELWGAIPFLLELLKNKTFHKHLGKGELLLLLDEECFVEGFPVLKAFVTLCDKDEIVAPELFPWVGFVFTFPKYRGNRFSEKLIDYAAELAKTLYHESENLYVSTDHVGLYEKYGFSFLEEADTVWGEKSRILFRPLR